MRLRMPMIMATASSIALATSASAHAAPSQAAVSAAEEATLGEIVVTARRRAESLQEVPQAVSAVTADTLQKLEIKQFADIQAVVPGLTLQSAQNGYGSAASLRGVTYNVLSGAPPTVAMYFNDAPSSPTLLFASLF